MLSILIEEIRAILSTYNDRVLEDPEILKKLITESLDSDKAENVEVIDLRGQTSIADFMVVASGRSSRQVGALAEKLEERLSACGMKSIRVEGKEQCDWVIVDAGDIIVHLFRPEVREFYAIEKMWRAPHLVGGPVHTAAP